MPKNLAQSAARLPISGESKPRFATAPIILWVSPGAFAGDAPSMAALVENRLAQSRVVVEPEGGHDRAVRVHRIDQSLALEYHPNRGIAQPAGIAGGNHGLAEVKMVAVRIRRADGDTAGLLPRPGVFAKARELLQQGQGLELQRIKVKGVLL